MNVGTALLFSLGYFLANATAATAASEPARIVWGISQSAERAGPVAYLFLPLLLTLPAFLAAFLELYGRRRRRGAEVLHDRIVALVQSDALGEAMALLGRRPHAVVTPIYQAALARAHQPMAVLERGVRIAELELLRGLSRRRRLSEIVSTAWAFGAVVAAAVGERDLAIGGALVFLGCVLALTILTARRDRLGADVRLAALRIVDLLESRYLEPSLAETSALASQPSEPSVVPAAIPSYEEMLDLPSEATS